MGALARGKQAIIVGDPKQLPPTNFFGRADGGEDDPDIQEYEKDLESILDEAKASGLPVLQLNWHYRSQHESLSRSRTGTTMATGWSPFRHPSRRIVPSRSGISPTQFMIAAKAARTNRKRKPSPMTPRQGCLFG
ncbi:hypothetical protein ACOJBO_01420 [Rhizobium beringeri]